MSEIDRLRHAYSHLIPHNLFPELKKEYQEVSLKAEKIKKLLDKGKILLELGKSHHCHLSDPKIPSPIGIPLGLYMDTDSEHHDLYNETT